MKRMKSHAKLLLIGCILLCISLAGVYAGGEKEKAESAAKEPAKEAVQERVTIKWWGHNARPMVALYNTLIPEFEKENPNITVEYAQKPGGQYIELFRQAYAAGSSPDVCRVGNWVINEYIRDGVLSPFDLRAFNAKKVEDITDQFIPGFLDPILEKEGLYALAESAATLLNVVNLDFLAEAGYGDMPADANGWVDAMKKMTKKDGDHWVRSGFEWKYGHELWDVQQFTCLVRNEGTTIYNKDGTLALDREKTIKALTYYYDSIHTHKFANPAFADTFGAISPDVFSRGFAGSTTAGAYVVNGIVKNKVVKNWIATEWVTGPERSTLSWTWAYGISSQSKHILEASKWIAFITTSPGIAERRKEMNSNMLGVRDWMKSPYLQANPKDRLWWEILDKARPTDPFVDYAKASIAISNVMQKISMGGMKPEEGYKVLFDSLPRK